MGSESSDNVHRIRISLVNDWESEPIVELYRAGGWWKESMDPTRLPQLIKASFLFAVATDIQTGESIGMGRAISDGIADAYIQDVVVLPLWRRMGVGRMIVSALLEGCLSQGISWIGVISQPGAEKLYRSLGFKPMVAHIPMMISGR